MKVTTQFFGAALLAMLSFAACKNTDFKKTKDGMPYKVFSSGSGDKIVAGNVLRAHVTNRIGDSVLNTTYGRSAQVIPLPPSGPQLDGLRFFLEAHKGDSILLLQSIDSILAKNPGAGRDSFLTSNKGKNIETTIKIIDVFKDEQTASAQLEQLSREEFLKNPETAKQKTQDDAAIDAYLKSKNINTSRTPWGTYVQTLTPGNGQKAKPGQFVSVRYTGKTLSGEEFDSNNKPGAPLLPVQIGRGGTIPGFEDGLKQLSKGEKAILYIPSVAGYGANGAPPKIGPNQNLMFEIEVVDIADQPAQQPMMPPPSAPMDSTRK